MICISEEHHGAKVKQEYGWVCSSAGRSFNLLAGSGVIATPPPFPPLSLSSSPCMDGWASCPYMDSEEEGLYWVYALYSVSTCWWDNLYCYCSVQGFPSTYKIPVFCFIEIQSVIELSYFLVAPVLGLLMSRNRIRLYDSTSILQSWQFWVQYEAGHKFVSTTLGSRVDSLSTVWSCMVTHLET